MLVVVLRSLIILLFLMAGLRLMGKRTIGEFQPFEFVIVLAVAELAATPMQDLSTPIIYGLVPLITIFVAHFIISTLNKKSIRMRKFMNGKPMIIIDDDGINSQVLKQLNLNTDDLMEMIRGQGCFSVEEIDYAIMETNGKLSVMQKDNPPSTNSIPMSVVVEGKIMGENIKTINLDKQKILDILKQQNMRLKDVLLMTLDSKKVFLQPMNSKYITFEAQDV
ncbi:MAG: DUF421 domain-containing protein [Bacillota bacterium]